MYNENELWQQTVEWMKNHGIDPDKMVFDAGKILTELGNQPEESVEEAIEILKNLEDEC
jgi:hypothetical protein